VFERVVCDKVLCVSVVCEDCVCVYICDKDVCEELCVCGGGCGRRERTTDKQEPHSMMWGKKEVALRRLLHIHLSFNTDALFLMYGSGRRF